MGCSTRRRSPTSRTAWPTPTPPGTKPVPTPKLKLLSRPTPPSRPPRLLTPGAPAPTTSVQRPWCHQHLIAHRFLCFFVPLRGAGNTDRRHGQHYDDIPPIYHLLGK